MKKFKELLHNFETNKRIYAVRSVVTPPTEVGGLFDFQLKLETYYEYKITSMQKLIFFTQIRC